jgi:hypothetical protein
MRDANATTNEIVEKRLDEMADYVLHDSDDINVFAGPLVYQPSDGTTSKIWYFTVATSEKGRGFRCDQLIVETEMDRAAFIVTLLARPPIVVHDMADELVMAEWCEAIWPGLRIAKIRQQLAAERASHGATP